MGEPISRTNRLLSCKHDIPTHDASTHGWLTLTLMDLESIIHSSVHSCIHLLRAGQFDCYSFIDIPFNSIQFISFHFNSFHSSLHLTQHWPNSSMAKSNIKHLRGKMATTTIYVNQAGSQACLDPASINKYSITFNAVTPHPTPNEVPCQSYAQRPSKTVPEWWGQNLSQT